MSGHASWAANAIAYAKKDGKLVRAQSSQAGSVEQLLHITREHFGVERALALVPAPSDRLPKP